MCVCVCVCLNYIKTHSRSRIAGAMLLSAPVVPVWEQKTRQPFHSLSSFFFFFV